MEERLSLSAWRTMMQGLVAAGVRRVRITGGEPLLSRDVVPFVQMLGEFSLDDVALTTNATRLAELARPLRDAGLRRINISLDTLDPDRFWRMTRGGDLAGVLRGVDAAIDARFDELKMNVVVVRGENEGELLDLVRFAWDRGIVPRFLEVMGIGEGAKIRDRVVSYADMRKLLEPLLCDDDAPTREHDRGPAKYVRSRTDPAKKVGFITGTTDTYCKGCDRLRVAADGVLRPCLATNDGVSAQTPAQDGQVEGILVALDQAWRLKPDGDTWRGCTEETAGSVSIRRIGG
jgi:cyclic pyranopterin phosphate synthase